MSKSNSLINYRKTVQSQWGEDGIIEEIFRRIGVENKMCVEFGAWDGKHLSNTWHLWNNEEWEAVLIEGDPEKFNILEQQVQQFNKVRAINRFVTIEGENCLDKLLAQEDIPQKFDLLSIDIDSDDYYIFESLKEYTPRLVIVEYNPTIPPELEIVQERGEYFGASALALINMAHKKDYTFVCCTESNCFFVLNSEFPKLNIGAPNLRDVFPREFLTYVITSQDGMAFLTRQPTYMNFSKRNAVKNFLRRKTHPILLSLEDLIPVKISKS